MTGYSSLRDTREERRAYWQEWKGAYRRDWSTALYFVTWLEECHPIGYALFLGFGLLALVTAVGVYAAIPLAICALLGTPAIVGGIALVVWLCFALGAIVAWGGL